MKLKDMTPGLYTDQERIGLVLGDTRLWFLGTEIGYGRYTEKMYIDDKHLFLPLELAL